MKDHEFQQYNEFDRLKRRDQDAEDLQNEVAGRDVGRQKRFLPPENHPEAKAEKERREFAQLSALALRLQDAEYAKLYYELGNTISLLEQATAQAMEEIEIRIEQQNAAFDHAMSNATKLHDGRAIFKDDDGMVKTLDGTEITDPVLLESIVWKENSPSYREIHALQDGLTDSEEEFEELRDYQVNLLGAARDRLEDEDHPPSKEELEEIKRDVYEQAPEVLHKTLNGTANTVEFTKQMPQEIAAFKM